MNRFSAVVTIKLKAGVADPQGQTIERALPALSFEGVENVRVGKSISFDLQASDAGDAERLANEMCEQLLANPVIESYDVSITGDRGGKGDE